MSVKIILAGLWLEQNNNFEESFEETKGLAEACDFVICDTLIQKEEVLILQPFLAKEKYLNSKH